MINAVATQAQISEGLNRLAEATVRLLLADYRGLVIASILADVDRATLTGDITADAARLRAALERALAKPKAPGPLAATLGESIAQAGAIGLLATLPAKVTT